MSGISNIQVSALYKDINCRVNSLLDGPLDGEWLYFCLDATYRKTRENGLVLSVAAIITTGFNTEGRREVLGLGLGPSEAAVLWLDFLRKLEKRGLKGVKRVISDAHEGLKAVIAQVFKVNGQRVGAGAQGPAPEQRCRGVENMAPSGGPFTCPSAKVGGSHGQS